MDIGNITLFNTTILTDVRFMSLSLSLLFCFISTSFTLYLIAKHLKNWTDATSQTCIVRILIMVIIYAVNSFLSMLLIQQSVYFDILRDCYESFVLYSFFCLIIHYFEVNCRKLECLNSSGITTTDDDYGGSSINNTDHIHHHHHDEENDEDNDNENNDEQSFVVLSDREIVSSFVENSNNGENKKSSTTKKVKSSSGSDVIRTTGEYLQRYVSARSYAFPFCCCPLITPDEEFFIRAKRCVIQYIIIRPLATLASIVLHIFGLYNYGSFSPFYGYLWTTLIINFSACVALYWLYIFFEAIYNTIKDHKPLAKFLSVKLMIFFMFWQSIAIAVVYHFRLIPSVPGLSPYESSNVLNNFIISFETVILSIFHIRIFSSEEFKSIESCSNDIKLKRVISNGVKAIGNDILNPVNIIKDATVTFTVKTSHNKDD